MMPRYRVTLRHTTVEIIEADNPYQAAIAARDLHGDTVQVADVVPAVGRPPASTGPRRTTKTTKKSLKKVAKKRRRLSPEARAKLAQNLVKARAARAAKRKGSKSTGSAKKSARVRKSKRVVKKR
jgi:hypothetical protein